MDVGCIRSVDDFALSVSAGQRELHAGQRQIDGVVVGTVAVNVFVLEAVNRAGYRVAEHQPCAD